MTDKESEFGKGFAYCIGMLLAHAQFKARYKNDENGSIDYSDFFYPAVDHLSELTLPKKISEDLKHRTLHWKSFCLARRLPTYGAPIPSRSDYFWAISEAKEILRLWDEECGIETIKGNYK